MPKRNNISLRFFIFYTVLLFFVGQNAVCQEDIVKDTSEIMQDLREAEKLIGVDNSLAEKRITSAEKLVNSLNYQSESAANHIIQTAGQFLSVKGYLHYSNNQLNEAVQSFQKAQFHFKRIGAFKERAECLNNSAVILNTMGNNLEAINNYHEAISIYEDLNDSLGKGYAFNNVSRLYRQQGDYGQALEYVHQSLKISESTNDKSLLSLALNSKAGLLKVTGDTTGALDAYKKALSIRKEVKDSLGIASVLNNIGSIFKSRKNYEKALSYFTQAKEIALRKNYKAGIGHTNHNMGEVYLSLKKYNLAIENGSTALSIAKELSMLSLEMEAADLLKRVYKNTDNWEEAFKMQEIVIKAKEKIVNQETREIAQRESMRYEFEKERALDKKEQEQYKNLQKEKGEREQIYYIAIVLVTLLLLFLLLFVINRLKSAKIQNKLILKQSNERKLLLQEVHHRVKNNFQIVSSLLRLQSYSIENESLRNSFEEAVSRINAMAIVHDIIYRQEKFSEIDSKEYLEKLIKSLQKTSGDPNIDIVIHTDRPKLKIETLIHLGIALNELVINSFKYAFNGVNEKPKIKITMSQLADRRFELVYQDNGVGLNKELSKSSFGMELIETLIEHLDGEVVIENLNEWKTTIILRFSDI